MIQSERQTSIFAGGCGFLGLHTRYLIILLYFTHVYYVIPYYGYIVYV